MLCWYKRRISLVIKTRVIRKQTFILDTYDLIKHTAIPRGLSIINSQTGGILSPLRLQQKIALELEGARRKPEPCKPLCFWITTTWPWSFRNRLGCTTSPSLKPSHEQNQFNIISISSLGSQWLCHSLHPLWSTPTHSCPLQVSSPRLECKGTKGTEGKAASKTPQTEGEDCPKAGCKG